ncbi:MAG: hypothetical protein MI974_08745 [Chitinophagales bacterium]|nr:hypothetical protein [Chitinophagales bacterium]
MANPFRTYKGFYIRVNYIADIIRAYGANPTSRVNRQRIYNNRKFDDCFESSDGDALVYALMEKVIEQGDHTLEKGIEAMGATVKADWTEHYWQAKDRQLSLF